MSAELLYGILFMVVVFIIVIAGGWYMWVTREKPAPKKPKKPAPMLTSQAEDQDSSGTYIPPEVPRTFGTIKQIAGSEPEMIEEVLRGWIKGEIAPERKLKQELQKKKRRR